MHVFLYGLIFVIGSVAASFMNCVAYRYVKGVKWWRGRSICEKCGEQLRWYMLIPIFSYLFCKGRCCICKQEISKTHLYLECFGGIACVIMLYIHGSVDALWIQTMLFCMCLYGLSIIDDQIYVIPDAYLGIAGVIWLLFCFDLQRMIQALFIGLVLFVVWYMSYRIQKKECMGFGDIKLFFVCALYLKQPFNIFVITLSCIFALLYASIFHKKKIAFAPCISFATYILLLISF